MAKLDWLAALNLRQSVENIHTEMLGDWYQDPWGWPELGFLLDKNPDFIVGNLNSSGVRSIAQLDVPKENWGTRPAVILDVVDRVSYHALTDHLSVKLIGEMSPDIYGWRLPAIDPSPGLYSHNNKQWEGYRSHLSLLADLYSVALKTDLVSCFASMPAALIQEAIQDRCPHNDITNRLCDMVGAFSVIPNRSGLMQRSTASAVIANMYLAPLDDVLKHHSHALMIAYGRKVHHRSFARWMDDIWLFGNDQGEARQAQMDLQGTAQSIGLNLNYAKTEVLTGPEMGKQAKEIEHSAVDGALIGDDPKFGPLELMIDKIIDNPEKSGRTSIRFAAVRMRKHGSRYRVEELFNLANRMPHAADSWSRFFKDVFVTESLQDWYLDYVRGNWATHEWAVAHYGRLFPSSFQPGKELLEFFDNAIRDANTGLALLAVAAQRMSEWDSGEARDAYREGYRRSGTPHARRVLGLAALKAGESRSTVKKWLSADVENAPTLAMLESYGWNGPKIQADFAN
jgi:hypothetical protein